MDLFLENITRAEQSRLDRQAKSIRTWFLATVALGVVMIYLSLATASTFSTDIAIEEQITQSLVAPPQSETVVRKKQLKLPTPIFVVGYPKSGTTTVWNFFHCSGVLSQHFCCCGDVSDHPPCETTTMAKCLLRNLRKKRPMLQDCGDYEMYAQLDGERPIFPVGSRKGVLLNNGTVQVTRGDKLLMRHFLPQHFHLDEIHEHAPHATYILPLRDPLVWANSAFKWFQMRGRFVNEYISHNATMERPGKARAIEWLARIYLEHAEFIRDFVRQHPTHALVEVNITDENAGKLMADAFGLDEECWGHHNKREHHAKLTAGNATPL